jgi:hypothetical protein
MMRVRRHGSRPVTDAADALLAVDMELHFRRDLLDPVAYAIWRGIADLGRRARMVVTDDDRFGTDRVDANALALRAACLALADATRVVRSTGRAVTRSTVREWLDAIAVTVPNIYAPLLAVEQSPRQPSWA